MSDNHTATKNQSSILIIIILVLLSLAVYWPVQYYGFINFDDHGYITSNRLVRSGISLNGFLEAFYTIHLGNWHPFTMISHMLDWQLFKDQAGGHHWSNVIIHIFNTVLLFLFLKLTTGAIWRSALVAALFVVHPINVESVAWLSQRKNVLSTFFWISTMLSYVWYTRNPGWQRYLPVLICFALGLMSKPMLVTVPFVLLLLDYWPLKRTKIYPQNEKHGNAVKQGEISFLILEKIPLLMLSAIFVSITLYAQKTAHALLSLHSFPLFYRIGNAFISYGLYIKKMFWPFDLAVFYPFNYDMNWWHAILAALAIIAMTIFACIFFRRLPYVFVGWFWYLGTLVPVIGIVQVGSQSMADRYAYFPLIGLFIIFAWGGLKIFSKIFSRRKLALISAVIVLVWAGIAYLQVGYWKDTFTLFTHTLKVTRNNAFAHSVIAGELLRKNKVSEAIIHIQKALALDPQNYNTLIRLAWVYNLRNDKGKAIEALRKAIKINPKESRAYEDLYVTLLRSGKNKEALREYRKAAEINIDNPDILMRYGKALTEHGLYAEAKKQYERALFVRPKDHVLHYNLGVILIHLEKSDEAIKHFKKATYFNPQFVYAHLQLAKALEKNGQRQEAAFHYQEAKRISASPQNTY